MGDRWQIMPNEAPEAKNLGIKSRSEKEKVKASVVLTNCPKSVSDLPKS